MSDQIPYLSDEELQKLMAEAELETSVRAPEDLEEKVIARIESRECKKTIDFAGYCARVAFGVAAAIALLCLAPSIPEGKVTDVIVVVTPPEKEIPTREEVLGNKTIKTREEALSGNNAEKLVNQIISYFE